MESQLKLSQDNTLYGKRECEDAAGDNPISPYELDIAHEHSADTLHVSRYSNQPHTTDITMTKNSTDAPQSLV